MENLHIYNPDTAEWLRRLISGHKTVRKIAREYLDIKPERALPLLGIAISSDDKRVRWEALTIVVKAKRVDWLPLLVLALHDEIDSIRWLAADGIVAFGEQGINLLSKALKINGEIPHAKRQINHVYRKFGLELKQCG